MSDQHRENLEQVKKLISSVLISHPSRTIPAVELEHDYEELVGNPIPHSKFDFLNLQKFLLSIPDVLQVSERNSVMFVTAVVNQKVAHIQDLIDKQKKSKKKNMKKLKAPIRLYTKKRYEDPVDKAAYRPIKKDPDGTKRSPKHNFHEVQEVRKRSPYKPGYNREPTCEKKYPWSFIADNRYQTKESELKRYSAEKARKRSTKYDRNRHDEPGYSKKVHKSPRYKSSHSTKPSSNQELMKYSHVSKSREVHKSSRHNDRRQRDNRSTSLYRSPPRNYKRYSSSKVSIKREPSSDSSSDSMKRRKIAKKMKARKGSSTEKEKAKSKERGRSTKKKSESGSSSSDSSRSSSESSSSSGSKSSSSSSSGSSSRSSSSSSDSSSSRNRNRNTKQRLHTKPVSTRKSVDKDKKSKEKESEVIKDKEKDGKSKTASVSDKKSDTKHHSRSRSRSSHGKKRHRSPTPRPTKIHIGRLTRTVNKEHIVEIFGVYGTIKHVEFPKDHIHVHIGRGYAYVEYSNADEAEDAMKHMDGGQIDGQEITAAPVLIPKPRPYMARRSPMPMRRPPMRRPPPPHFRRRSPPRPPRRSSPIRRRPRSRNSPAKRRKRSRSSSSSSR